MHKENSLTLLTLLTFKLRIGCLGVKPYTVCCQSFSGRCFGKSQIHVKSAEAEHWEDVSISLMKIHLSPRCLLMSYDQLFNQKSSASGLKIQLHIVHMLCCGAGPPPASSFITIRTLYITNPPIPPRYSHREMFCYIPQRLNTFVLTHWVVWCNGAKNKPMFGQKRTEKSWKCSA